MFSSPLDRRRFLPQRRSQIKFHQESKKMMDRMTVAMRPTVMMPMPMTFHWVASAADVGRGSGRLDEGAEAGSGKADVDGGPVAGLGGGGAGENDVVGDRERTGVGSWATRWAVEKSLVLDVDGAGPGKRAVDEAGPDKRAERSRGRRRTGRRIERAGSEPPELGHTVTAPSLVPQPCLPARRCGSATRCAAPEALRQLLTAHSAKPKCAR
jgi:hypothetical protein